MTKIIKQKVQKSVSEKEILNLKIKKNCLEAVKIENKIKHSEKKKKKKKNWHRQSKRRPKRIDEKLIN